MERKLRDKSGRFIAGHPGLKPKGSKNQIGQTAKEALEKFCDIESQRLPEYFSQIKSPAKRIELLAKLLPFVVPKLSENEELKRIKAEMTTRKFIVKLTDDDE